MKNLIAYFQTHKNIELAYLFGSRATGRFTPNSDYDIGLKLKQPISFSDKFFMEVEIRKLLETQALDLVLIDEATESRLEKLKSCLQKLEPLSRKTLDEIEGDLNGSSFEKNYPNIFSVVARNLSKISRNWLLLLR